MHPEPGSHWSVVHGLSSSQSICSPVHTSNTSIVGGARIPSSQTWPIGWLNPPPGHSCLRCTLHRRKYIRNGGNAFSVLAFTHLRACISIIAEGAIRRVNRDTLPFLTTPAQTVFCAFFIGTISRTCTRPLPSHHRSPHCRPRPRPGDRLQTPPYVPQSIARRCLRLEDHLAATRCQGCQHNKTPKISFHNRHSS